MRMKAQKHRKFIFNKNGVVVEADSDIKAKIYSDYPKLWTEVVGTINDEVEPPKVKAIESAGEDEVIVEYETPDLEANTVENAEEDIESTEENVETPKPARRSRRSKIKKN